MSQAAVRPAGLLEAVKVADSTETILIKRDLAPSAGLVYVLDQLTSPFYSPFLNVPLSDWAFRYSSTIWHQPPGLITR